jgi:hypothetical protein
MGLSDIGVLPNVWNIPSTGVSWTSILIAILALPWTLLRNSTAMRSEVKAEGVSLWRLARWVNKKQPSGCRSAGRRVMWRSFPGQVTVAQCVRKLTSSFYVPSYILHWGAGNDVPGEVSTATMIVSVKGRHYAVHRWRHGSRPRRLDSGCNFFAGCISRLLRSSP